MERSSRRRSLLRRAPLARWAVAVLLLGVPLTFPSAGAVFAGSTSNTANQTTAG